MSSLELGRRVTISSGFARFIFCNHFIGEIASNLSSRTRPSNIHWSTPRPFCLLYYCRSKRKWFNPLRFLCRRSTFHRLVVDFDFVGYDKLRLQCFRSFDIWLIELEIVLFYVYYVSERLFCDKIWLSMILRQASIGSLPVLCSLTDRTSMQFYLWRLSCRRRCFPTEVVCLGRTLIVGPSALYESGSTAIETYRLHSRFPTKNRATGTEDALKSNFRFDHPNYTKPGRVATHLIGPHTVEINHKTAETASPTLETW